MSPPSPEERQGSVPEAPAPAAAARRQRGTAKQLRAAMNDAERALWRELRGDRFAAAGFRRQVPIGRHVVDFGSARLRLIVEIDSGRRVDVARAIADGERDAWLKARGYRILRFWNDDVLTDTETVLAAIVAALATPPAQPEQAR